MKCRICGHEMLITERFLNYWIKWLCPKDDWTCIERLKEEGASND